MLYEKTFFCYSSFILYFSVVMALSNKGSSNYDGSANEIWACLNEIPETYQEGMVRVLPGRQQYSYKSESESKKFILEITEKEKNLIVDIKKEEIEIGNKKGKYYVYNGEAIDYVGMDEHEIESILKMENNDRVIEWEQSGKVCKLYGNLNKKELINVAENVVILYE